MIININEKMRIAQTSNCYVIQERKNNKLEFITTRYFTTIPRALKRALELTDDPNKEIELKEVLGEVNKMINNFVKGIQVEIGKVEEGN